MIQKFQLGQASFIQDPPKKWLFSVKMNYAYNEWERLDLNATMSRIRDYMRGFSHSNEFRRLAAKTLCAAFQEQARDYLWPLQIGVAQPLGTEVGLQVARQWCYRNKHAGGKVFVKLDFAKCYKT